MTVASVTFRNYAESVAKVLDLVGASDVLGRQSAILIKPNLINADPHPVTTPPACCEALIDYIRACSAADIVIAEGCGDAACETGDVFAALGYEDLAARKRVRLIDLNTAPLRLVKNTTCRRWPEIQLPEIVFSHYLISVPVLKAHSLADITGSCKNMMGLLPPGHYGGHPGSWKKALFHNGLHQSIRELVCHRTPDLSLMDATIGLAHYHLGGPPCEPPVNRLLAGFDPLAMDREAAALLGMDWQTIPHLAMEPDDRSDFEVAGGSVW
ncbi:MAG: DUF362 domain-containing protein [Desulfobacterales bacterium]|nr:DUF362 domain-containing protein [Desulfobacterales bacterium]